MARGGARKGAGRKAGLQNAKTRAVAMAAASQGITPVEVLLESMRMYHRSAFYGADGKKRKAPLKSHLVLACGWAKDAAPFIHPRLATHEVQGVKGGEPIAHRVTGSVKVYLPDNGRRAPAAS